jgi:hypothetical protein
MGRKARDIVSAVLLALLTLIAVKLFQIERQLADANRHASEANAHSAENSRMLRGRDFDRVHREHAALMERCGR